MKICIKCEIEKDLSDFSNRKDSPDGKRNDCKLCGSIRQKKNYLNNIIDRKAKSTEYYFNNKKRITEYKKEYSKNNRDKINANRREWYKKNPEKSREYYDNNIDSIKVRQKKYRAENKEKISKDNKKWRDDNHEYLKDLHQRKRDELQPSYVAQSMRMSVRDLTPEILETKRNIIQLKRELKINHIKIR